jgi:aspartate dehydrogenase
VPLLALEELVDASDLVVESATQAALTQIAPAVLEHGRDLLVLSVGALLDHPEWIALAATRGATVHVPAGIDLDAMTKETCVFDGSAREACRAFPANVNVVAAVSLAGLGPDATRMRVYAVPGLSRNRHTVKAEGRFGRLQIEIENIPTENPRTGRLSYLSTIAYLVGLGETLRVGT